MGVEYRISARTLTNNMKWKGVKELLCHRCGVKISVGDWIHRSESHCSLRAPLRKDARFYHLRCFEELFLDV